MRSNLIVFFIIGTLVISVCGWCGNPTVVVRDVTTAAALIQDGDPSSSAATYGSGACQWRFTTTSPGHVINAGIDWSLGTNYDRLIFYDGFDASAPQLAFATGTSHTVTPTAPLVTTGNTLFVTLLTDAFMPKTNGFFINATSALPPVYCPPVQYYTLNNSAMFPFSSLYEFSEPPAELYGKQPYAANRTCQWVFNLTGAATFTVIPSPLVSGYSYNQWKPTDSIEIRRGPARDSPLIAARMDWGDRDTFVVDAGIYSVVFVSRAGDKLGYPGLQFSWTLLTTNVNEPVQCHGLRTYDVGGTPVTASQPTPSSLILPPDADTHDCQWLFRATTPGQALSVSIQACFGNAPVAFRVYDGANATAPLLHQGPLYADVVAVSGMMYVTYHVAGYTTYQSSVKMVATQVPRTVDCVDGSITDVTSTATGTTVSNPTPYSDGYAYAGGRVCKWTIDFVPGMSTYIEIDALSLNPGDNVTIHRVSASNALLSLVQSWTNTQYYDKQALSVSGQRLMITFSAAPAKPIGGSGGRTGTGFRFFVARDNPISAHCSGLQSLSVPFYSTSCVAEPTASTTTNYAPNSNCQWRLTAPSGQYLSVHLGQPTLRKGDYLRVYDGNDATAPLLANITGAQYFSWGLLASTGNIVYVTFVSGPGNVSYAGFSFSITNVGTSPGPDMTTSCGSGGIVNYATGGGQQPYLNSFSIRPGTTCAYIFHRTDWTAALGGFRFSLLRLQQTPGESFIVYDSMDTSGNIIYKATDTGGVFGYAAALSPYVRIEYKVPPNSMGNGNAEFQAYTYQSAQYPFEICSGLQVDNLLYNYFSPGGPTIGVSVPSGTTCNWLETSTYSDPSYNSFKIAFQDFGGGFYGTPKNNQSYFAIYDGNSTAAPLLVDQTYDLSRVYQTSGRQYYVTFRVAPGQVTMAYGFYINSELTQRSFPCSPYQSSYMKAGYYIGAATNTMSYNTYTNVVFSTPRTCVWEFFGTNGTAFRVDQLNLGLGDSDSVTFYTGSPNDRRVLMRYDASAGNAYQSAPLFADTYLYIVYDAPVAPTAYGFTALLQYVSVPDAVCSGNRTLLPTDSGIAVGSPLGVYDLTNLPYNQISAGTGIGLASPPARVPVDCWYHLVAAPGMVNAFSLSQNIKDGSITFYRDGELVLAFTGAIDQSGATVCWDLDMHVQINSGDSSTFWYLVVFTYQISEIFPYCQVSTDVPCPDPPIINTLADALPYVNCTIIDNLQVTTLLTEPFPLNNLRVVYTFTTDTIRSNMTFNHLEAVYTWNINNGYPGDLYLPAMTHLGAMMGNSNVGLTSFIAPKLRVISKWRVASSSEFLSISLPRLTTINDCFSVYYLPNMALVDTPNLVDAGTFVLYYSPLLTTFDLPNLVTIKALTITGCNMATINLPRVLGPLAIDFTLQTLRVLSLPSVTGFFILNLAQAVYLELLDIRSARWIASRFSVDADSNAVTYLDSFEGSPIVSLTGLANPLISLPNMVYANTFYLGGVAATELALPAAKAISTLFAVQGDFSLAEIDMCNLEINSTFSVSQCPELSCAGVVDMFSPLQNTRFSVAPPDCAAIPANFGCQRNVQHVVNITACGYTVACIQASIDIAFKNRDHSVYIPAGTYTGCAAAPLSTKGKVITVLGAGMGQSVIDCQGNGRAMVFNTGEGRAVQLQDVTLRNGAATNGGALLIDGTSPTLLRVSLEFSTATLNGGALFITNGAAPLILDSLLSNSTAGCEGGALAINASTVTLRGVTCRGNVAGSRAGAMTIRSPLGAVPLIQDSLFVENSAPQGGALYTDAALAVNGSTFARNLATEFGGAVVTTQADNKRGAVVWLNATGVTFRANLAPTGGAVYAFSSSLHLVDNTLDSNSASGDGGGVLVTCSPSLRFVTDTTGLCDVRVLWERVTARDNLAGGSGGALRGQYARLNLNGGSFLRNHAAGDGGGVYATTSSLELVGATMDSNSADGLGGGVYCEPSRGGCTVSAVVFTGNCASTGGGGLYACTLACPNVTSTSILGSNLASALSGYQSGNTFAGNCAGAEGYGADLATDPTVMTWHTPPNEQAVSGVTVSQSGSVTVEVRDSYGSIVTLSKAILAPSLDVITDTGTSAANAVRLQGAKTSLVENGLATFSGTSLIALDKSYLNAIYNITARLTSAVSVSQAVYLVPCAAGQGYSGTGEVVCVACQPGTAGSLDTGFICQPCAAGTFSTAVGATTCTPCALDTFTDKPGATACQTCPLGQGAAAGSSQCTAAAKLTGFILPLAGASAGALILLILGALCVYRLARRKTMKKYYLDSDSTIRATGLEETPLMKLARKMIVASSTTRVGGGAYADVYKAKHEKQWVALKVLKKEVTGNSVAQREFRQEAVALSRLGKANCAGIVQLVFFLERNPMCLAMEFCAQGSLKTFTFRSARRLTLPEKYLLCAEAAAALAVVHACDIIHQDIKTDNMLLDENFHIKVADFGISRVLETDTANPAFGSMANATSPMSTQLDSQRSRNGSLRSLGGPEASLMSTGGGAGSFSSGGGEGEEAFTPQYCDPLRLAGKSHDPLFLRQADVYSFGIMMWAIYAQEEPYAGVPGEQVLRDLKSNPKQRPPAVANMDAMYGQLMRRAWDPAPSVRPSFAELRDQLATCLAKLPPGEGGARQLPYGYHMDLEDLASRK